MDKKLTLELDALPYNVAVKEAYFKLLAETKTMLAKIEREELRCTYQREDHAPMAFGTKLHEIISPLFYLSLECQDGEKLTITFGFENFDRENEFAHFTNRFLRFLFRFTSVESSRYDIQDCVSTDYVLTDCSALFETIEDSRTSNHVMSVIPYKKPYKRKSRLKVA